MVKADVTMRCKDNSLVYVTFFTGDKLVAIKTPKDGPVIRLTAETTGGPFMAEGYSFTGTPANMPGRRARASRRVAPGGRMASDDFATATRCDR